jgi:hypothetical protein
MFKILSHPLTIVFITLCTVIFSLSMTKHGRRQSNYQPQVQALMAREQELQTQKEILEFKKELSAKSIVQEKIIRDDLWRQKPGEIILDLSDFQMSPPPPPPPAAPPPSSLQQWQRLLLTRV